MSTLPSNKSEINDVILSSSSYTFSIHNQISYSMATEKKNMIQNREKSMGLRRRNKFVADIKNQLIPRRPIIVKID